jgi:uncharacterized linocin/CFP29 family protein
LIASEFLLGMRAIEAYDAGCQPLDVCSATRAARDVALEEERLIYYGSGDGSDGLLRVEKAVVNKAGQPGNKTEVRHSLFDTFHDAIQELAFRGYAGPFALAVDPALFTEMYVPNAQQDTLRIDLIRNLFRGGVHMAPVIAPGNDDEGRRGAIVTLGRAYSRLVVGQDWVSSYRGRDGVFHRFLIMSSLQLRVCDPRSIQVLVGGLEPSISHFHVAGEQPIEEVESGTQVVIAGSNLGERGEVTFAPTVGGRAARKPARIDDWSAHAVTLVHSFAFNARDQRGSAGCGYVRSLKV